MSRRSDQKSKPEILSADLSRRSFIERVVGGTVGAPALMSLTGAWIATEATAFAQSYGSSSAGHSESSAPYTGLLYTDADSTLRKDAPNTNEGANPRIRVSARPVRRGIVHFDPYVIGRMSADVQAGATAYLRLTIAENNNNWGQSEDHVVDVHPLPPDFFIPEGNGAITGLPAAQVMPGYGNGVTWNSANDPDISNNKKDAPGHDPNHWKGGSSVMQPATAPGQVHINQQTGVVEWDVTEDVRQGANAWVIKLRDDRAEGDEHEHGHGEAGSGEAGSGEAGQGESGHHGRAGDDPFRGGVDYFSREGVGFNYSVAPQLEVIFQGGHGEASSSRSSSSRSSTASRVSQVPASSASSSSAGASSASSVPPSKAPEKKDDKKEDKKDEKKKK